MALPNVGLTCYVSVALQLMADVTRDVPFTLNDTEPTSMLAPILTYLRCTRSMDMPLNIPRSMMVALCSELGIEVGIPEDPSRVLMQICLMDELVGVGGNYGASRVCSKCNTSDRIGVQEFPFSMVMVPLANSFINLLSLFETRNYSDIKCTGCGCTDASNKSLRFGDRQTLIYLHRETPFERVRDTSVSTAPVHVSFPLSLCKDQELMGIAVFNPLGNHYTYICRHTDGIWRWYNDEYVEVMPADWFPDSNVVHELSDKVVALVYGPPIAQQEQHTSNLLKTESDNQKEEVSLPKYNDWEESLVNDIYKLSPHKPRQFARLLQEYTKGPWVRVCLNNAIMGCMLYVPDCTRPYVTQDNLVVFYDVHDTGLIFLLPAGDTYITNKPISICVNPLQKQQDQPRIDVKVI